MFLLIQMHLSVEWWAALAAIVSFGGAALVGLYRVTRKVDDTLKFIGEVRLNHLPHLYFGMRLIGKSLGLDVDEEYTKAHPADPE